MSGSLEIDGEIDGPLGNAVQGEGQGLGVDGGVKQAWFGFAGKSIRVLITIIIWSFDRRPPCRLKSTLILLPLPLPFPLPLSSLSPIPPVLSCSRIMADDNNNNPSSSSATPRPKPPRSATTAGTIRPRNSSPSDQNGDGRPPTKRARKPINCEPCRNSKLKCDRFVAERCVTIYFPTVFFFLKEPPLLILCSPWSVSSLTLVSRLQ